MTVRKMLPQLNRRRFIQLATLASAGAVSGFSGCGVTEVEIPCLGPAAPPTPVPGRTYILASEIGCALDCDLTTGKNKYTGGMATDDGPRINEAMAGATAENPITLIIDGSALISGLYLPEGGHWGIAGLGCGTGFFVKTGTNNDGIHNGPAVLYKPDPGPPAPARGSSVSLANFTLNGNSGNGKNGDSTTGDRQGNLKAGFECYGINLINLDDIRIENVVIVNSPAYHIRLSNVGQVSITGCVVQSTGPNTDGFHFDGPANDIMISNCTLTTGDDGIALNCPEGYSGDIARVTVTGCTFRSTTLMRLDTIGWLHGLTYSIEDVKVSNCRGSFDYPSFDIGDAAGSKPEALRSLVVTDCVINAPAVLDIWSNFGTISLQNVTLIPRNSNRAPGYAIARTNVKLLNADSGQYSGTTLSIENCTIHRTSGSEAAALILQNESTIANLRLDGFALIDDGKYGAASQLVQVISGSIGQMVLDAVNSSNVRKPVSDWEQVGSVSGAGVLSTGWEFPDAVMADDVPYISASTGLPSIKIDGVVEAYP